MVRVPSTPCSEPSAESLRCLRFSKVYPAITNDNLKKSFLSMFKSCRSDFLEETLLVPRHFSRLVWVVGFEGLLIMNLPALLEVI